MDHGMDMMDIDDDVIVIGSGIAGLVCALSLAPRRVTLITKTPDLAGGSSFCAKGGIAAAVGPGDSPQMHAQDTLAAGAGLSDEQVAIDMASDGVAGLQALIDAGVPFDRAVDGTLELAREAAHERARVVHAGGDSTGEVLVGSLAKLVRETRSIKVLENTFAWDLVVDDGCARGVVTLDAEGRWATRRGAAVILATGGIGMCWWQTTNPEESTGDGLAMAARAGARLADLEFMQFHPTALAVTDGQGGAKLPLLTEALRGAGALLLDGNGQRFMISEHSMAELAPRDVVARAIQTRVAAGEGVFLDLRPVIRAGLGGSFPQAINAAGSAGFDPATDLLPVVPAAHYHMGGVATDNAGRTSVPGLWACGEVATTGVHGANRLASNSLLEGLVFARRVAADIEAATPRVVYRPASQCAAVIARAAEAGHLAQLQETARRLMSRHVGIVRGADGLASAAATLADLEQELESQAARAAAGTRAGRRAIVAQGETRNLITVARLVTLAAQQREESRGAHFRYDYPVQSPGWCRRQNLTIDNLR